MTIGVVIGIALLGGVGAIARFALDTLVSARVASAFPYGTLAVNLSGAFVLGAFVGGTLSASAYKVLGTGLIGAYTTFSTWMFESHRLGEDRQAQLGWLDIGVSLVLGVLVAWAGKQVGAAL